MSNNAIAFCTFLGIVVFLLGMRYGYIIRTAHEEKEKKKEDMRIAVRPSGNYLMEMDKDRL